MDILRDPIWQSLGVIVTLVLGFVGFYYAGRNRLWLGIAGVIVAFILGFSGGIYFEQRVVQATPALDTRIHVNVNDIIARIEAAPGTEIVRPSWWREDEAGPKADNFYHPLECFGIAWSVQHDDTEYYNTAVVFTTPQRLQPLEGAWYVKICPTPDIYVSPEDVGRIAAAMLEKQNGGEWTSVVLK
ncbi:MAG TPA: hypothetical protein VF707_15535 [Ardenticatenaceae bacterium]